MTFDALENELPNGFHDAELLGLEIDYVNKTASLDLLVDFSMLPGENIETFTERDRRGRLKFSGVQFVVIDSPGPGADGFAGSRIDAGSGVPTDHPVALPAVLSPTFLVWVFVVNLNAFIRIAADDVSIAWRDAF